ncbi:MAG: hypothetical protein PHI68_08155, partial [Candidatus Cloacimonetes bacterium]|nr:hypothetical protein [Candidatus Cloacimonadota bacterium]
MKNGLGIKILALFIALVIWFQIVLISEHTIELNIPLTLTQVPKDVSIDNYSIPFSITGRGYDLLRFYLSKPRAELDGSEIMPGTTQIPITNYKINKPASLNIAINPITSENLSLNADVLIEKTLPVKTRFSDSNLEKYFASQMRILPPEVTVSGPKNKVENLREIYTYNISRKLLETKDFRIDLQKPDPSIIISEGSVQILIREMEVSLKVLNLPIDTSLGRVVPSSVTVKIT